MSDLIWYSIHLTCVVTLLILGSLMPQAINFIWWFSVLGNGFMVGWGFKDILRQRN